MQQQFFTLSPMPGQESFGNLDVRPQHMIAHTPTTSSMLAALQQDSFPAPSLDPTSSAFNSDAYGSLSYMDTSASQDDAGHPPLSFPDFPGAGNSFDTTTRNLSNLSNSRVHKCMGLFLLFTARGIVFNSVLCRYCLVVYIFVSACHLTTHLSLLVSPTPTP
ncbi:hypothetical protein L208DRAFT_617503 [Tricholoma matsutake]|nr:hypothetical protein L208DRAFT_617503 [Tricholoma matsutake 945]